MNAIAFALLASLAHADLNVLSLRDVVAAQENRDGTYEVICANGNRETVSAVDVRTGNVCPNEKNSVSTDILSLQKREDGQYDVVCRNLSRTVATMQQILNDEVCKDTAPAVVIEDGVYVSDGSLDCTIHAIYQDSRLVGLEATFPGTSARMTCVDEVCTGQFSGYPQLYRFEILSTTSFEYSYDDRRDRQVFNKRP